MAKDNEKNSAENEKQLADEMDSLAKVIKEFTKHEHKEGSMQRMYDTLGVFLKLENPSNN